jgi:hypothetical protein
MGQSFACKLGLHPSILPRLSSITSNFENSVPKQPLDLLEDNSLYMNVTIYFLYVLGREGTHGEDFSCTIGLHPSTLARLCSITSNFEK